MPGKIIAEQKSAGRKLDDAEGQTGDYALALPSDELPQIIVVSDFATFRAYDLQTRDRVEFTLAAFPDLIRFFGSLIEDDRHVTEEELPVNQKAAEHLASLHNLLEASRYTGHDLELLLVRLMSCLFADDARIFVKDTFKNYLSRRTSTDGRDFGPKLVKIFEVPNTPIENRQTTLNADLQILPYISNCLGS